MKVIVKGGKGNNERIIQFFLKKVLPIMGAKIEIEVSDQVPTFYKKIGDDSSFVLTEGPYFVPTAEIFVDLSRETIKHALKGSSPIEINPDEMRKTEFLAVKKIAELKLNFKINFHPFVSLSSD